MASNSSVMWSHARAPRNRIWITCPSQRRVLLLNILSWSTRSGNHAGKVPDLTLTKLPPTLSAANAHLLILFRFSLDYMSTVK